MALARTTLAAAVGLNDLSVLLTSISGLAVGQKLIIDEEEMRVASVPASAAVPVPVTRGINGTAVKAHVSGAGVVSGLSTDFATPRQPRRREIRSYSAAGAIALPTPGNDMVAILNGTTARAMTLANPAKDNDGDILTVIGNGKAAHTVTYAAGLGAGGAGLDVMTFDTNAQCSVQFMAVNEVWVPLASPLSGTLTGADVAVA